MKFPKLVVALSIIGLLSVSLMLVACGDNSAASPTPGASTSVAQAPFGPTSTAIATSTSPVATASSGETTAAPTGTDQTSSSVTTPSATTPVASAKGGKNNAAAVMTPEAIVNKLYSDIKSGDLKKGEGALISQNLATKIKGKKASEDIYGLIGISKDQKIDSFSLSTPTVSGDKATLTATLKLVDGTTVTDNLTMVKNTLKTKQGQERTLWQLDSVTVG